MTECSTADEKKWTQTDITKPLHYHIRVRRGSNKTMSIELILFFQAFKCVPNRRNDDDVEKLYACEWKTFSHVLNIQFILYYNVRGSYHELRVETHRTAYSFRQNKIKTIYVISIILKYTSYEERARTQNA